MAWVEKSPSRCYYGTRDDIVVAHWLTTESEILSVYTG